MPGFYLRRIAFSGVIAALYAALTIIVAPIAYGPVQFRLAEVLCILPFFFPTTTIGLFVGCFIANLLSPYGILDIIAGPIATLIAAVLTMNMGKLNREAIVVKALACLPPVFINALIIGAVIAWATTGGGEAFWSVLAINGLQIGFGQFVVMYAAGLPLMIYLPKLHLFALLCEQYNT